ncbi:MAG: hypothetical protein KME64_04550 [Scytonematopsis contorta HA4267-MV1]|jgi:hypothetical protein|nr:hypothetical protein [Scytonematopsis contorta HA4267-MV1]
MIEHDEAKFDSNQTEHDEPLGIKKPLLAHQPLGQRLISPKFLSPLGANSLLNFDHAAFLNSDTSDYTTFENPFQDSPFFQKNNTNIQTRLETTAVTSETSSTGSDSVIHRNFISSPASSELLSHAESQRRKEEDNYNTNGFDITNESVELADISTKEINPSTSPQLDTNIQTKQEATPSVTPQASSTGLNSVIQREFAHESAEFTDISTREINPLNSPQADTNLKPKQEAILTVTSGNSSTGSNSVIQRDLTNKSAEFTDISTREINPLNSPQADTNLKPKQEAILTVTSGNSSTGSNSVIQRDLTNKSAEFTDISTREINPLNSPQADTNLKPKQEAIPTVTPGTDSTDSNFVIQREFTNESAELADIHTRKINSLSSPQSDTNLQTKQEATPNVTPKSDSTGSNSVIQREFTNESAELADIHTREINSFTSPQADTNLQTKQEATPTITPETDSTGSNSVIQREFANESAEFTDKSTREINPSTPPQADTNLQPKQETTPTVTPKTDSTGSNSVIQREFANESAEFTDKSTREINPSTLPQADTNLQPKQETTPTVTPKSDSTASNSLIQREFTNEIAELTDIPTREINSFTSPQADTNLQTKQKATPSVTPGTDFTGSNSVIQREFTNESAEFTNISTREINQRHSPQLDTNLQPKQEAIPTVTPGTDSTASNSVIQREFTNESAEFTDISTREINPLSSPQSDTNLQTKQEATPNVTPKSDSTGSNSVIQREFTNENAELADIHTREINSFTSPQADTNLQTKQEATPTITPETDSTGSNSVIQRELTDKSVELAGIPTREINPSTSPQVDTNLLTKQEAIPTVTPKSDSTGSNSVIQREFTNESAEFTDISTREIHPLNSPQLDTNLQPKQEATPIVTPETDSTGSNSVIQRELTDKSVELAGIPTREINPSTSPQVDTNLLTKQEAIPTVTPKSDSTGSNSVIQREFTNESAEFTDISTREIHPLNSPQLDTNLQPKQEATPIVTPETDSTGSNSVIQREFTNESAELTDISTKEINPSTSPQLDTNLPPKQEAIPTVTPKSDSTGSNSVIQREFTNKSAEFTDISTREIHPLNSPQLDTNLQPKQEATPIVTPETDSTGSNSVIQREFANESAEFTDKSTREINPSTLPQADTNLQPKQETTPTVTPKTDSTGSNSLIQREFTNESAEVTDKSTREINPSTLPQADTNLQLKQETTPIVTSKTDFTGSNSLIPREFTNKIAELADKSTREINPSTSPQPDINLQTKQEATPTVRSGNSSTGSNSLIQREFTNESAELADKSTREINPSTSPQPDTNLQPKQEATPTVTPESDSTGSNSVIQRNFANEIAEFADKSTGEINPLNSPQLDTNLQLKQEATPTVRSGTSSTGSNSVIQREFTNKSAELADISTKEINPSTSPQTDTSLQTKQETTPTVTPGTYSTASNSVIQREFTNENAEVADKSTREINPSTSPQPDTNLQPKQEATPTVTPESDSTGSNSVIQRNFANEIAEFADKSTREINPSTSPQLDTNLQLKQEATPAVTPETDSTASNSVIQREFTNEIAELADIPTREINPLNFPQPDTNLQPKQEATPTVTPNNDSTASNSLIQREFTNESAELTDISTRGIHPSTSPQLDTNLQTKQETTPTVTPGADSTGLNSLIQREFTNESTEFTDKSTREINPSTSPQLDTNLQTKQEATLSVTSGTDSTGSNSVIQREFNNESAELADVHTREINPSTSPRLGTNLQTKLETTPTVTPQTDSKASNSLIQREFTNESAEFTDISTREINQRNSPQSDTNLQTKQEATPTVTPQTDSTASNSIIQREFTNESAEIADIPTREINPLNSPQPDTNLQPKQKATPTVTPQTDSTALNSVIQREFTNENFELTDTPTREINPLNSPQQDTNLQRRQEATPTVTPGNDSTDSDSLIQKNFTNQTNLQPKQEATPTVTPQTDSTALNSVIQREFTNESTEFTDIPTKEINPLSSPQPDTNLQLKQEATPTVTPKSDSTGSNSVIQRNFANEIAEFADKSTREINPLNSPQSDTNLQTKQEATSTLTPQIDSTGSNSVIQRDAINTKIQTKPITVAPEIKAIQALSEKSPKELLATERDTQHTIQKTEISQLPQVIKNISVFSPLSQPSDLIISTFTEAKKSQPKTTPRNTYNSPLYHQKVSPSPTSYVQKKSSKELPTSWGSIAELATANQKVNDSQNLVVQPLVKEKHKNNGYTSLTSTKQQQKQSQINTKPTISQSTTSQSIIQTKKENSLTNNTTTQEHTINQPSSNDELKNLETLAQEIYKMLRRKLEIEQERRGNHSRRLP